MDRRQQKTRQAIFHAVSKLLEKKRFESITVQEIIDEANIGRSTFYAHFETKDELLHIMCKDIFQHVFASEFQIEKTHDFSHDTTSIHSKLTHILYHLKDNEKGIMTILSSNSNELFLSYFKEYMIQQFQHSIQTTDSSIPQDFILNYLVGSFVETIKWWISKDLKYSPEEVIRFYLSVTNSIY